MPEDMPEDMSEYMPEDMPDRMPEDMSEYMPEDMPDRMPEDMSDRMPEDMPDRMPNRMSEDMSDRMPEDLPVRKCINVMVGITRSKVIHCFTPSQITTRSIRCKFTPVVFIHDLFQYLFHLFTVTGNILGPVSTFISTSPTRCQSIPSESR